MEYYNAFPYLPPAQQAPLMDILDQLNKSIEIVTKLYPSTVYIQTAAIIAQNYPVYLPNPADIHLSLAGYQAIAGQFFQKINKSKVKEHVAQ
jgi:hypothetical protein